MKRVLIILVIVFILNACGQMEQDANEAPLLQHKGIIVSKIEWDNRNNQVLLVSGIKKEDMENKAESEIMMMAAENEVAYYGVSDEDFHQFDVGASVIIYWNGDQEDSEPPGRYAVKIEAVASE